VSGPAASGTARTAPAVRIEAFDASRQDGVVDLILPIQREEFGFAITLADQPDLLDVEGFYREGGGNFWVALADDEVVGTIALRDIDTGQGALRKMFVKAAWRGPEHRVAQRLLDTLLAWCGARGIGTVFLGTTEKFHAAHRFYEKNGFGRIECEALPAGFPRMGLDTRFYRRSV